MNNRYASLLLLATAIVSCSSDTPTSAPDNPYVKAKVGSTFTYEAYSTDSLGAIVAGTRDTSLNTILSTNGSIAGKTGVLIVEIRDSDGTDTSYFFYESNNNLSSFQGSGVTEGARWVTFPVATSATLYSTAVDSSEFQGNVFVTHDTLMLTPVGSETIAVQGQSIATNKVKLGVHVVGGDGTGNSIEIIASDIFFYYAPSLGFMVKWTSPYRSDEFGNHENGRVTTLISYVLK